MNRILIILAANLITYLLYAQSHINNVEDFNASFYNNTVLTGSQPSSYLKNTNSASKKSVVGEEKPQIHALIEKEYQPKLNDWVNHIKYEYTYDDEGNKLASFWYGWNEKDKSWTGHKKNEPTYNEDGVLTELVTYRFKDASADWVKDSKLTFKYNRKNKVEECIYYLYNKNNWVKVDKKEFIYNGRVEEMLQWRWNSGKNDWEASFKNKNVYYAHGGLKSYQVEKWNFFFGRWINLKKSEVFYNEANQLDNRTNYFWANGTSEDGKGKWVTKSKQVNTYTGNSNLQQTDFFDWDMTAESWIPANKKTYSYNSSGAKATASELMYYNRADKVWVKGFKSSYNYPDLNESGIAGADLKVFPNPSDDAVTFDIAKSKKPITVQLYDMEGKQVLSETLNESGQIKVGHFSEAMYVYKLQRNGVTYTGKLSVK